MEDKDTNSEEGMNEDKNYDSEKVEKEDAIDDHSIVGDNVMDIYEIAINKLWKKAQQIDMNEDLNSDKINEIYELVQVTRYTFNAAKEVIEFSEENNQYFDIDITDQIDNEDDEEDPEDEED